ncbi:MAG TPA: hypothetical protein VLX28_11780 [Thermoanaerobaculia bacterium]|nr:hypothetical protein [Thermoanaerobaculia bacterium]
MAGASAECENHLRRHLANPFLVLELAPGASRDELERQGAKLLALLAAGVGDATAYPTPLGIRDRTAEMVRAALAELRDPARRLLHEWWAQGLAGQLPVLRARQRPLPE